MNFTGIIKLSLNEKHILLNVSKIIDTEFDYVNSTIEISNFDDLSDEIKSFLFENKLRINTIECLDSDLNNNSLRSIDTTNNHIYSISLDTYNEIPCNMELNLKVVLIEYDSEDATHTINHNYYFNLCISKDNINQYNYYDKAANMINSNMESFMLLRTNPKLTGNIKLVVSEDYNLYLDSFKVSKTSVLNNKEYRHQAIPADGDYPHDVYKVFKSLPKGELYNVYDDSYDPHKNYYDINLLIENIYEYGAEYNNDKLYSENMKILAPLYIGKHLPTYFAIYRSDRLLSDNDMSSSDTFKNLMSSSECIKIFDLRLSTTIGKYLTNYQKQITKYLSSSCFLQFIEQDNEYGSNNYRQGRNIWKGISIDKGILTEKAETTYFGTEILNQDKQVQENYNMFLLDGFYRNNILFPNIINLEFMFNDAEANDLSMHSYFGLYLTENDFLTFNLIIKSHDKTNSTLTYYDENNKQIKLEETCIDIIENKEYDDRIFFASTLFDVMNLSSKEDLNMFIKEHVMNKPYKNLVLIKGTEKEIENNENSFITLRFTEPIHYGEHLKFVALNKYKSENVYENVVIELIGSNDERLVNTRYNINPYVSTNTIERPLDQKDDATKIYRMTFYTLDLEDKFFSATLEDQIERIVNAINYIDNFITVENFNENTIGLTASCKDVYFQHILANEYLEDVKEVDDTIRCFNFNNTTKASVIEYEPDLYRIEDMPFANNGLEILRHRYSNITKFINFSDYSSMYIYEVDKDLYEELNKVEYPIISTENGYYPIIKFNVGNSYIEFNGHQSGSSLIINEDLYGSVISPWNINKCIIASLYKILPYNNMINICTPLAMNVALMGINNIKDIDMYTNIQESYNYSSTSEINIKKGEKILIDNSDIRLRKYVSYSIKSGHIKNIPVSTATVFTITDSTIYYTTNNVVNEYPIVNNYLEFDQDTVIVLLNENFDEYNYTTNKPILNENNYYIDINNKTTSNLNIPLVPLVNCQWKSNGNYFDNNSLLDINNIVNDYNNVGNFNENIYNPCGENNSQYIVNKLSDVINYNGISTTIKDFILSGHSIKKYLITNCKLDTAIGYYNPYVQTLEFIYYGIQFSYKLTSAKYTNEIKLNEFNNYEIFIINDFNSSNTNEMFISKSEEFILIVNHVYNPNHKSINGNVKLFNNFINDVDYTWYNAPYNYELINTAYLNNSLYFCKSNNQKIKENISYFIEEDLDLYNDKLMSFDENPVYSYINASYINYGDSFDTLNNYLEFVINDNNDLTTLKNDNINSLLSFYENVHKDYRSLNSYIITENNDESNNITNDEKIENFIESFSDNITINIISLDNTVKVININENYKPLTLTLTTPNKIKYNQGLFNPNFVDIFNFNVNDNISKEINLDTLCSNTTVSSINSIKNYYNNKVMENDRILCTYNYFMESDHNIFSTDWDNIYRLYTNENSYNTLYGYTLGLSDKTFFGSKCLTVHNNGITLNNWNYNNNDNTVNLIISQLNMNNDALNELLIKLNLTKTFYNYIIKELNTLYNNWRFISDRTNINVYITNYINKTLSKIYNFKDNFDVKLYMLYDPTINANDYKSLFISYVPSNIDKYEEAQNITTLFEEINNEIILTINIAKYKNYYFYPTVKINKI